MTYNVSSGTLSLYTTTTRERSESKLGRRQSDIVASNAPFVFQMLQFEITCFKLD